MRMVFFPTGAGGAHLIRNDGARTVRLLMFGGNGPISLTVYPDSDKIRMWDRDSGEGARFVRSTRVDYYHGEGVPPA